MATDHDDDAVKGAIERGTHEGPHRDGDGPLEEPVEDVDVVGGVRVLERVLELHVQRKAEHDKQQRLQQHDQQRDGLDRQPALPVGVVLCHPLLDKVPLLLALELRPRVVGRLVVGDSPRVVEALVLLCPAHLQQR